MKRDSLPASPPPTVNTIVPNSPSITSPQKLPRDIINTPASNYRVAQACDRCRSKKIRCDGKRPTCSQCAAVGFECRITDKLIRRAFPRGYTESLEERVRELEAENRRLLALCDLKEQQIDIVTQYSRARQVGSNQNMNGGGYNGTGDTAAVKNLSDREAQGLIRGTDNNDNDSRNRSRNNDDSPVMNISQTNLILLNQTHQKHTQYGGLTVSEGGLNSPAASECKPSQDTANNTYNQEDIDVRNGSNNLVMDHSCDNILCDHGEFENSVDSTTKALDSTSSSSSSRLSHPYSQYNGFGDSSINAAQRTATSGKLHLKPVSMRHIHNPEFISFEQDEAPGLLAAKALKSVKNHERSSQLTVLVALSIPRSTSEILFIPQLFAKVRDLFGFTSKHCLYTVTLLSSLKCKWPPPNSNRKSNMGLSDREHSPGREDGKVKGKKEEGEEEEDVTSVELRETNLWDIDDIKHFFKEVLRFNIFKEDNSDEMDDIKNSNNDDDGCGSGTYLTLDEIDELVSLYFEHWSSLIPVLSKEEFNMFYNDLKQDLKQFTNSHGKTPFPSSSLDKVVQFNYKFFACFLVVICQMGILTKIKNQKGKKGTDNSRLLKLCAYYHKLIPNMSQNPYFTLSTTSIKSLQLLSLIFFYHLNCGDIIEIYSLRGKIISMEQQLRLQRCPSAVLTVSGSSVNNFEQSNRRFLFWTLYYLDVFASLQLGVPRLIKDYEIECALPLAETDSRTASNSSLGTSTSSPGTVKLEGYVTQFSLAIIRFSKILGSLLDRIFERNMTESVSKGVALIYENALDNWRSRLPDQYLFKLGVNGSMNLSGVEPQTTVEFERMVLIFLYFLAKCVIHLPIFATKTLSHDPPVEGGSGSGKPHMGNNKYSSSYVSLQQATNTMLYAYKAISGRYIALPINLSRTITRFSLISVQGSLDYIKGGSLYIDNKNLLLGIIQSLENDRRLDLPGVISWNSLRLLDLTINLFLQGVNVKPQKLEKVLEKRLNYYNKLMGEPPVKGFSLNPLKVIEESETSKAEESVQGKVKGELKRDTSSSADRDDTNVYQPSEPPRKKVKPETGENFMLGSVPKNEGLVSPELTQTAFAEAMQLDPVLNQNLFQLSGQNLNGFSPSGDDMRTKDTVSNLENIEASNDVYGATRGNAQLGTTDTRNTAGSNVRTNFKRINSLSNFDMILKVPSWADFFSGLQSVLPPSGNPGPAPSGVQTDNSGNLNTKAPAPTNYSINTNSNSLLNMFLLMNSDSVSQQNEGQLGRAANTYGMTDTNPDATYPANNISSNNRASDFNLNAMTGDFFNSTANYGHVVDVSLGLAPLLIEEEGGGDQNDQTMQNGPMLGLGPGGDNTGPSGSGNHRLGTPTGQTATNMDNQGDDADNNEVGLVMEAPRRFGNAEALAPSSGSHSNTDGNAQREPYSDVHYSFARRNKNTGAVVDLYNWQNSK